MTCILLVYREVTIRIQIKLPLCSSTDYTQLLYDFRHVLVFYIVGCLGKNGKKSEVNILIVVVCEGKFREIILGLHADVTVNMRPQLKAIICLRKIPLFYNFKKKEIYSQHFFKFYYYYLYAYWFFFFFSLRIMELIYSDQTKKE